MSFSIDMEFMTRAKFNSGTSFLYHIGDFIKKEKERSRDILAAETPTAPHWLSVGPKLQDIHLLA